MAKQSFVTGQVLTAAQLTSLQQTAMSGGAASAKTASYTLVAADAGTAISMSSTSATTITINTGLFAAGDTVFIQNLNTGICTITAGTATVNTSASLALAQYEGGTIYFTSASAALFFKGAGAAPAGGAYTQLATGSLSGSSLTISPISGSYKHLYLQVINAQASSGRIGLRINGSSSGVYTYNRINMDETNATVTGSATQINVGPDLSATADRQHTFFIENYATTSYKPITIAFRSNTSGGSTSSNGWGSYNDSTAITSLTIVNTDAVSYTAGTYTLYGVN